MKNFGTNVSFEYYLKFSEFEHLNASPIYFKGVENSESCILLKRMNVESALRNMSMHIETICSYESYVYIIAMHNNGCRFCLIECPIPSFSNINDLCALDGNIKCHDFLRYNGPLPHQFLEHCFDYNICDISILENKNFLYFCCDSFIDMPDYHAAHTYKLISYTKLRESFYNPEKAFFVPGYNRVHRNLRFCVVECKKIIDGLINNRKKLINDNKEDC